MRMRWAAAMGAAAAQGVAVAQPGPGWLDLATQAANWIDSHAVETEAGVVWPVDPEHEGQISRTLYAGSPGVVLFFLELHEATGDQRWLERARLGAADLAASIDDPDLGAGLYTGLGGVAFTLGRAADIAGDEAFDDAARRAISRMHDLASVTDAGASWGPVTDIISGDAGGGLALLWAHERWGDARDLELAARVGRHLLATAIEAEPGLSWPMSPDFPRVMPNFSHGTAGVAFFLARLAEETGDEAFLDGAIGGGERLLALTENGLIHHHTPGGEDLHYLGWCHGPTGTGRLYDQLHRMTGEASWRDAWLAGAQAILDNGAPARRNDGYWENVGVCCGSAGMAGAMLDLERATGDDAWRTGTLAFIADIIARPSSRGDMIWWLHAEHRTRPDLLVAQTGYMQGAAGVGLTLLRFHGAQRERPWTLRLPDEPVLDAGPGAAP